MMRFTAIAGGATMVALLVAEWPVLLRGVAVACVAWYLLWGIAKGEW